MWGGGEHDRQGDPGGEGVVMKWRLSHSTKNIFEKKKKTDSFVRSAFHSMEVSRLPLPTSVSMAGCDWC